MNLRVMEKVMVGSDFDKWLEVMKSERGFMYENKVYILEELFDGYRIIE